MCNLLTALSFLYTQVYTIVTTTPTQAKVGALKRMGILDFYHIAQICAPCVA